MTRNQRHAVEIARAMRAGRMSESAISDRDWNLLLLAAEINDYRAKPLIVCWRVLERATKGLGYFAGRYGRRAESDAAPRIPSAVVNREARLAAAAR
jgi:hypothetical protein